LNSPQLSDVLVQPCCSLADLPLQQSAVITEVTSLNGAAEGDALRRRMAEIGFLPGEKVKLVARVPGGDPVAVRVGSSTFALRHREAQCIQVSIC
jgi:ferrous iron transport protein A